MICSGRFGVLIVWVFLRSCMPRYQPRQGVRKQSRWLQATSSSKSVLSGKKKKSLSGLNNSKRPFGIILRHAFIDLPSIRECMKNNHQCRGAQTTYEHKHPGPLHISPKQRGLYRSDSRSRLWNEWGVIIIASVSLLTVLPVYNDEAKVIQQRHGGKQVNPEREGTRDII